MNRKRKKLKKCKKEWEDGKIKGKKKKCGKRWIKTESEK